MDKEHRMQIAYDREGDVLYLSIGAPREAISREIGDDVLLRVDPSANDTKSVSVVVVS